MSDIPNNVWAVVKDGVIVNTVLWDGEKPYETDGQKVRLSELPPVVEQTENDEGQMEATERPPQVGDPVSL